MVYEFPREDFQLPDFQEVDFQEVDFQRLENRDNLVSTETEANTEKAVSTKKKNNGSPSGERASGGDSEDEYQAVLDKRHSKPLPEPDDTPKTPG
jgi:hypothetical protein